MNEKEAKKELGISTPTLYRYVKEGRISRMKNQITGRVTYDKNSVLELKAIREGK